MIREEFTNEEMGIIRETLEDYVSGLSAEIYGADSLSFGTTQELLHKKAVMEDLIERIDTRAA
jgi:hypothetical protein